MVMQKCSTFVQILSNVCMTDCYICLCDWLMPNTIHKYCCSSYAASMNQLKHFSAHVIHIIHEIASMLIKDSTSPHILLAPWPHALLHNHPHISEIIKTSDFVALLLKLTSQQKGFLLVIQFISNRYINLLNQNHILSWVN